jgi:alpha-tubulin suppressor-like RCC1 family protein
VLFLNPFLENIDSISAGATHSLVLNQDGEVFSFGSNNYGEIGHSTSEVIYFLIKFNNLNTPKKISFDFKVKKILAGQSHSLIFSNDGRVFSFGSNSNGKRFY